MRTHMHTSSFVRIIHYQTLCLSRQVGVPAAWWWWATSALVMETGRASGLRKDDRWRVGLHGWMIFHHR